MSYKISPLSQPTGSVSSFLTDYHSQAGAPAKTPPEVIAKLNREINAVLAEPEVRKRLIELGGEPLIATSEDFGAMIKAETEKWEKVVTSAGIKIE